MGNVVDIEMTTAAPRKVTDETGLSPVMIFLIILFSAFGALLCGFLLYWLRGVQHSSDMELAWKEEPESRLPRGTTWLSTSRGHTTKTHEDTDTEWHSINLEQEDKLEEQDFTSLVVYFLTVYRALNQKEIQELVRVYPAAMGFVLKSSKK